MEEVVGWLVEGGSTGSTGAAGANSTTAGNGKGPKGKAEAGAILVFLPGGCLQSNICFTAH